MLFFFIPGTAAAIQTCSWVVTAVVNRGILSSVVAHIVLSMFLCWRECANNAAILSVLPVFVALFPESFLPTCLLSLCLLAYLPPALPFWSACSSTGIGLWMSSRVDGRGSLKHWVHFLFQIGLDLKSLERFFNTNSTLDVFALIGHNFLLWTISVKMPRRDEHGWCLLGKRPLRGKTEGLSPT